MSAGLNYYLVQIFKHESLNEDVLVGTDFPDAISRRLKDPNEDMIMGCGIDEEFMRNQNPQDVIDWLESCPGEFVRVYEVMNNPITIIEK